MKPDRTIFRRLRHAFGNIFWSSICLCYVLYWGLSANLRYWLNFVFSAILICSSLIFALESIATFAGHQLELIPFPFWGKGLVVLGALGMIVHRIREWRELWRESKFADVVNLAILETGRVEITGDYQARVETAKIFIPTLLIAFAPILKKRREVRLNVLREEASELKRFACCPQDARFDDRITFRGGRGAAGRAFTLDRSIYVPAVMYRHGIRIEKDYYDLELDVFEKTSSEEFRSVLCLPITAKKTKWGVLCIDSPERDPFNVADFRIARVAATLIATFLDRTLG